MKRLLPFALALFAATMFFTACGDDDSSSFVEPEKESSSSEILSSGATLSGDSHEGSSPSSCSSKDDKSSSSVSSSSTNSSSSAKSSSSTDSMSSSLNGLIPESCEEKDENRILTIYDTGERYVCKSGQYVKIESSSSSKVKKTCSADEEGTTRREDGMRFVCEDGYWVPVESSSSAVPTSSYFDMTNQFNEKVSYGEFTDPRDGQKYRTVSLYDDTFERTYVFFAENLNYGKMISGGSVQDDSTKYCYDDDPWYCDNGWGGLYTWSHAMNFPTVCDSVSMYAETCAQKFVYPSGYAQPQNYVQHQGICPEGWHIVNAGEWAHLDQRTGGSVAHYMGSKVAGFGSNDYGLSILPTGCWIPLGGKFDSIKKYSLYWLPQQYPDYDDSAYGVIIQSIDVSRTARSVKTQAFPVRCVKNY